MIHLYWGQGKGKTTAAMGLALRCLGAGHPVAIVQFLKAGTSSEVDKLRSLGARVFAGKVCGKFVKAMSEGELADTRALHDEELAQALALFEAGECHLLVLDEALDAYAHGLLDEALLGRALDRAQASESAELVLTGRMADGGLLSRAEYVTEMRLVKHPFQNGLPAREGIEF